MSVGGTKARSGKLPQGHEHFISAAQEREQIHTVEIAFTRDGILLGLRDVFTHDIGMYGALVAPVITACTVPGPYRIPNIHSEFGAVYTHLQPTSAVRGARRPQGVFVMERMMEPFHLTSHHLGRASAVHRRNSERHIAEPRGD